MSKDWYKPGEWNALCDVCGIKRKSGQLVERWDGLMVCRPSVNPGCFEIRHPQELIRAVPDQKPLPWTRPETTDVYWVEGLICTIEGRSAVAGYAVAGCSIAGMALHGVPSYCSIHGVMGLADFGTANCAHADNYVPF